MLLRAAVSVGILAVLAGSTVLVAACTAPATAPSAAPTFDLNAPESLAPDDLAGVPSPVGGPLAAIEPALSATEPLTPTEPITFTGIPLETVAALGSITYTVPPAGGRTYRLAGGSFDDIEQRTSVVMFPPAALGDLDGDGHDDAAVLLAESTGGSGTFKYLAVDLGLDGQWTNVDAVLLGDRVRIIAMSIADHAVTLDVITHGPSDPMCCPTDRQTWQFALVGGRLSLVSEAGPAAPAP